MKCLWTIISFQINCVYDWVKIEETELVYSQMEESAIRLPVRLCGKYFEPYSYAMRNNTAKITFHTDFNVSGDGFKLNWSSVDVSQCDRNMQNVILVNEAGGRIESINYPTSYLNNLKCKTVMSASDTRRVFMFFEDFNFSVQDPNCSDSLILSLDPTADTSYSQRLCSWNNSDINQLQFLSVGNTTELVFTTDDFFNGKGYSISHKAGEIVLCVFIPGLLEFSADNNGVFPFG